jgi:hypothetical protein
VCNNEIELKFFEKENEKSINKTQNPLVKSSMPINQEFSLGILYSLSNTFFYMDLVLFFKNDDRHVNLKFMSQILFSSQGSYFIHFDGWRHSTSSI